MRPVCNWRNVLLALVVLVYAFRIVVPTWRILALSLYRDFAVVAIAAPSSICSSLLDGHQPGTLVPGGAASRRVGTASSSGRSRRAGTWRCSGLARPWLRPGRVFADYIRRYREDLDVWKNRLNDHWRLSSAPITMKSRSMSRIARRSTPAPTRSANYFGVLATDRSAHRQSADSFFSQVRVKRGFVAPFAPRFGLAGRVRRRLGSRDRGLWPAGGAAPAGNPGADGPQRFASRDGELRLQRLQTFLFDCWLLWGPSIPICTCEAWYARPPRAAIRFRG
jgi:hypothetical protein